MSSSSQRESHVNESTVLTSDHDDKSIASKVIGFSLSSTQTSKKRLKPLTQRSGTFTEVTAPVDKTEPARRFISGISDNGIIEHPDSDPTTAQQSLVIPLISNPWHQNSNQYSEESGAVLAKMDLHAESSHSIKCSGDLLIKTTKKIVVGMKEEDITAAEALLADLKGDENEHHGRELVIPKLASMNEAVVVKNGRKAPLLIANQVPGIENIEDEKERFKHDVSMRPDELNVKGEAYLAVPVTEFGEAMLRGMGWAGPDPDTVFTDKQRRPGRLGLGATPKAIELTETSHRRKPGELSRRERLEKERERYLSDMAKKHKEVASSKGKSGDSSSRSSAFGRPDVGDVVYIMSGEHRGKRARISKIDGVPGLDRIMVALERSGNEVAVSKRDVQKEDHSALEESPFIEPAHKTKSLAESEQQGSKVKNESNDASQRLELRDEGGSKVDRKRSRMDYEKGERSKHGNTAKAQRQHNRDRPTTEENRSRGLKWVVPNLRVRIISKKVGKGQYFTQKAVVSEVLPGESRCTITAENGVRLRDVKESWLETALPKVGGFVMILRGEHKHIVGKLIERSSSKQRATVQVPDDMSIHTFSLDDVSEFVGDVRDLMEF